MPDFAASEEMLKSLPSVERELVNIERHYDLSENIYMLLMTKRTEAGILSAGNVSDAKIVEPAIIQSGVLVSPNKSQNNLISICSTINIFLNSSYNIKKNNLCQKKILIDGNPQNCK